MSQTEVIIVAGVFAFVAVVFILILIVLIKNHNNFGKRLRNLEEIISNSENIYSATWKNPLKDGNRWQRGTGHVGHQEQNYVSNDNKEMYGSNTERVSSIALQSATDYLQSNYPTQLGNVNPLEWGERMGEFENLPDVGISAAEFAMNLPERPAFFPGASRITNNPMFKNTPKNVRDPNFQRNRKDGLHY